MEREFIYFNAFDKNWEALGLNDDDLIELENEIMANPDAAELIQGTGGLRKIRFPLPGKGKSGGARVLYVDFIFYGKVFMINVYQKPEKENITDREKKAYKQIIDETLKHIRGD